MCYSCICSENYICCTQLTWCVRTHATAGGRGQLSETKEKHFINAMLYSLYTIVLISSGLLLAKNCHHEAYFLWLSDINLPITWLCRRWCKLKGLCVTTYIYNQFFIRDRLISLSVPKYEYNRPDGENNKRNRRLKRVVGAFACEYRLSGYLSNNLRRWIWRLYCTHAHTHTHIW